MDHQDWDLHAVVRGYTACPPVVAAADDDDDDPFLPGFSLSPFHHQGSPTFPDLENNKDDNPFLGLQEIYRDIYVNPQPAPCGLQSPVVQNQIGHGNVAAVTPHQSRPRRRKNQPMKMVHEMTQEDLAADSWAWRKYGQKPIKGSSYPRSYYRCSTSKCCAAKKHVERSPNDPSLFLVSYTGEHTHPRPTTRGTPSSKTPPSQPESTCDNGGVLIQVQTISSLSPSGFTAENCGGGGAAATDDVVMGGFNTNHRDDEILFHDSDHSTHGGDDLFSSSLLSSPPWSPSVSAALGGGEETG